MSMNISGMPNNDKARSWGAGAVLGLAGMNAYFLPVTKDRFVRTAFHLVQEDTEDKLELLNKTAVEISNKKLKPESKLFLAQLGVPEDIGAINAKCIEFKKSITDADVVKSLKKSFEDNFKTFKKSEASMDAVASRAFNKIRWTNFGWGAAIGFILGSVLASQSRSRQLPPQ